MRILEFEDINKLHFEDIDKFEDIKTYILTTTKDRCKVYKVIEATGYTKINGKHECILTISDGMYTMYINIREETYKKSNVIIELD